MREIEEPPPYELNAHDIGERRKLILARRHVAALRANPDLIIQAQAENDRQLASHRATIGNRAWRFLLRRSIDEIIAYMLQKSPTGRTLRSTSPFSMILPPEPEAERRRMWRAAKAELLADYPSGGAGEGGGFSVPIAVWLRHIIGIMQDIVDLSIMSTRAGRLW